MTTSTEKRCSRCKVIKDESCFGYKKNGDAYKTCFKCRSKNTDNDTHTSASSNTVIKNRKCLVTCYDPYKCIHDKQCKNAGLSCIDLKCKPFLDFNDVVYTCQEYGYNVLKLQPRMITLPLTQHAVENCGRVLDMMEYKIKHTKAMIVVKYNNDYDFVTDYFMESLPDEARMDAHKYYPCVIVKFKDKNQISVIVLRTCNSFEHFFTTNKLKHARKCNICFEKTRDYRNCYRCEHKFCSTCVKSMSSLTCPYCNYDIIEHHCNMMNLYDAST